MSLFGNQSLFGSDNHICGCYFTIDRQRTYLPQAEHHSHTTITPLSFTTRLTQRFHNPNTSTVQQLRYAFPLYDGVAVCGYTIRYGSKVLRGVVKQKDLAKQTFKAAVDRGETAGLLESLPAGVFGVTLGNVPAKSDIVVEITYTGELKHDSGIDGLRFVLPTTIAPRYGIYPGQLMKYDAAALGGMQITVDIDMGDSAVRKVQSPSHPISLQMGELSTAAGGSKGGTMPFSNSQASVTLSQGTCELSGDFVLRINIDDISKPQAILESHPDIHGHRALIATLVPKFALKPATPEIVFIADQSGSMSGSKNTSLVAALQVFIKSLPLGVRFNICAFGNRHRFLWPRSQAYNEDNVSEALSFVSEFTASYGGTELLDPIKETFKRHLEGMPLEVMLLTDGEIWQEHSVFTYINKQIRDKQVDTRVFALGIGQDVSHTLVEGVARAGNGFAQFVTHNEDTDQKVMRMLRAALYPHTKDYQVEVNYTDANHSDDEDDFEIVEKVSSLLTLKDAPTNVGAQEQKTSAENTERPVSFFDASADLDSPPIQNDNAKTTAERFDHLPNISTPSIIQAPASIPPLFPFSRSSVFLLLGPESTQKEIRSITLRAQSPSGPLELEIPVSSRMVGESIHQLAARKAIQDLEEGRGWLQAASIKSDAEGEGDVLIKKKYSSRFDEIVEREVTRLGEKFQVASKWTSFVAVEAKEEENAEGVAVENAPKVAQPVPPPARGGFGAPKTGGVAKKSLPGGSLFGSSARPPPGNSASGGLFGSNFGAATTRSISGAATFGASNAPPAGGFAQLQSAPYDPTGSAAGPSSGGLFGNASRFGGAAQPSQVSIAAALAPPSPFSRAALHQAAQEMQNAASMPFPDELEDDDDDSDEDMGFGLSEFHAPRRRIRAASTALGFAAEVSSDNDDYVEEEKEECDEDMGFGLFDGDDDEVESDQDFGLMGGPAPAPAPAPKSCPAPLKPSGSPLHQLIGLQSFGGAWRWSDELLALVGADKNKVERASVFDDKDVAATALVVAFFEVKVAEKKDVWEFVVAKARAWLLAKLDSGDEREVEDLVKAAGKYITR